MLAKESPGPSFDLPEEVLDVLPTDPYEQLDVARKITSIALATRISSLENELSTLSEKVNEKDDIIAQLQDQLDSLDSSLSDTADKLSLANQDKVNQSRTFMYFLSMYYFIVNVGYRNLNTHAHILAHIDHGMILVNSPLLTKTRSINFEHLYIFCPCISL